MINTTTDVLKHINDKVSKIFILCGKIFLPIANNLLKKSIIKKQNFL